MSFSELVYTHITCRVIPALRPKVSFSRLFVQYTRFSSFLGASSLSSIKRCSILVTGNSVYLLMVGRVITVNNTTRSV